MMTPLDFGFPEIDLTQLPLERQWAERCRLKGLYARHLPIILILSPSLSSSLYAPPLRERRRA